MVGRKSITDLISFFRSAKIKVKKTWGEVIILVVGDENKKRDSYFFKGPLFPVANRDLGLS